MTYECFEDLPVWQAAIAVAHGVFDLVADAGFTGLGDLRNQLQRASLSISNNIAEGFERGTTAELLTFLYYARGSAGETRSALRFAERRPELAHVRANIGALIPALLSVSRQLRGWAGSLQNSDIPGQRHLTAETKAQYDRRRSQQEFLKRLESLRTPLQPPQGQEE